MKCISCGKNFDEEKYYRILKSFAERFPATNKRVVLLLGDRFEIFAVAERSTALMTNPDLVALMGQIAQAEKDLEQARRAYDEEVRGYNALVTSFPGNKIGGMRYRPRMSVRTRRGRGGTERELPWTRF